MGVPGCYWGDFVEGGRCALDSEARKVTERKGRGETTLTSAAFRSSVTQSERVKGRPAALTSSSSGCDLTQSFFFSRL